MSKTSKITYLFIIYKIKQVSYLERTLQKYLVCMWCILPRALEGSATTQSADEHSKPC